MHERFTTLIPPQPEVLVALNQEISASEPDRALIAKLLKADVALYTAILKSVNSPYYGLATTVTSIERALSLLGLERIFGLVRLTVLRNTLNKTGRLERFWDTARDVSEVSVALASCIGTVPQDDAYALGMLHDCGIPLMIQAFPDYRDFLHAAGNLEPAQSAHTEQVQFGFDRFQIASRMAERWFLPQPVANAIRLQPKLEAALTDNIDTDEQTRNLLAVLTLAQDISDEYRYYWRIVPKQELSRLKAALRFLALCELDYQTLKEELVDHLTDKG